MHRLSATMRIAIGLVCLTLSVVLAARTLGLFPNRRQAVLDGRIALCEAIAITCSENANRSDVKRMEFGLRAITERNTDILSAAVRRENGQLLVEVGDHEAHWHIESAAQLADTHFHVPVIAGNTPWGMVEIRFQPLSAGGFRGVVQSGFLKLVAFMGIASLLVYFLYLRKMLQHMDPSKVVPTRVRAALDSLAGGLLILDAKERIVLSNHAFAQTIGVTPEELQGRCVSDLPWAWRDESYANHELPWSRALVEAEPQESVILGLQQDDDQKTFIVNCSPIIGEDGKHRGILASFDDVTRLEQKKMELRRMLEVLTKSREEIRRQNQELELLATQDPLTSCLNRRSFFDKFETHWSAVNRYDNPLSCIVLDLDHFKLINDDHGHSVGDIVLKQTAATLRATARDCDLVCRYGGEEFCILLPHIGLDEAEQAAERYRTAIESMEIANVPVTASIGVSATSLGAASPQELIEEADKSLYKAKREGRNRVVRWDDVPADYEMDEQVSRTRPPENADADVSIPFHAVTALISALGYRDAGTAEHSRRVADLCVAVGSGLMSVRQCYVLEIAALLHDIGKIGVPDSILLKPGPLTREEWELMGVHDRIGVEIVRSAFASEDLATIVDSHHAFYGGKARHEDLPIGEAIPLGARILSIADAYDAMITDRVYRKGRTREEAFVELRRCAGTQFDPKLVERFIEIVSERDAREATPVPTVSKQTALRVGLQIERLAAAIDENDPEKLAALAGRLKATAHNDGVPQIAEMAEQLESAAQNEPDMAAMLQLTGELLDICRLTQSVYLEHCRADDPAAELNATVG